jgi:peptidoglycan biosynthesis protein MviN/MurJ (putative lipid II flippase)
MWAYCSYQIFVRAFYSLKDIMTPLKVSCALMVLELALVGSLVWRLGVQAFGVTTAVIFSINTLVLAVLLRPRLGGRLGARRIVASVVRSLVACAAMCGAIWGLRILLPGRGNLLIVGVCVPAGAVIFTLVHMGLGGTETGELLGSLWRRRPSAGDGDGPAAQSGPAGPTA